MTPQEAAFIVRLFLLRLFCPFFVCFADLLFVVFVRIFFVGGVGFIFIGVVDHFFYFNYSVCNIDKRAWYGIVFL